MQHHERTLVLELIPQRVVLVVLEGGLPHGEALVGDDEADLVLAVHGDLRADKVEVELELLVLLVAQQLLPALVVKGVEAVEVQLLLLVEFQGLLLTGDWIRLHVLVPYPPRENRG